MKRQRQVGRRERRIFVKPCCAGITRSNSPWTKCVLFNRIHFFFCKALLANPLKHWFRTNIVFVCSVSNIQPMYSFGLDSERRSDSTHSCSFVMLPFMFESSSFVVTRMLRIAYIALTIETLLGPCYWFFRVTRSTSPCTRLCSLGFVAFSAKLCMHGFFVVGLWLLSPRIFPVSAVRGLPWLRLVSLWHEPPWSHFVSFGLCTIGHILSFSIIWLLRISFVGLGLCASGVCTVAQICCMLGHISFAVWHGLFECLSANAWLCATWSLCVTAVNDLLRSICVHIRFCLTKCFTVSA